MQKNPRTERLEDEFDRMRELESNSDILNFKSEGFPPEQYLFIFEGKGLMLQGDQVVETERHEAIVDLGVDWPQKAPLISWLTPIYHPNILIPNVCILGRPYSATTHLDEICQTLWDMIRYENYNVDSFFDRNAAEYARNNKSRFPVDDRELRNKAVTIRFLDEDEG